MLDKICKQFVSESGVALGTHTHSTKPDTEGVEKVVKVVLENDLLTSHRGRKHRKFATMCTHSNPFWTLDWSKMKKWVENKKRDFFKFNTAGEEHQADSGETDNDDNDYFE